MTAPPPGSDEPARDTGADAADATRPVPSDAPTGPLPLADPTRPVPDAYATPPSGWTGAPPVDPYARPVDPYAPPVSAADPSAAPPADPYAPPLADPYAAPPADPYAPPPADSSAPPGAAPAWPPGAPGWGSPGAPGGPPAYGDPYGPPPGWAGPPPPAGYGPPPAGYGLPAQAGYGPPPHGVPYGPTRTNGLAVASLILSISTLACGITALLGIVLGHVALSQIRRTGEQGRGLAIAGLVIGYAFVGLFVLFVVVAAAGGFASV